MKVSSRHPSLNRASLRSHLFVLTRAVLVIESAAPDRSEVQPRARNEGWGEDRPVPGGPRQDRQQHHIITEAHGIPLAVILTGGNRNDVTRPISLIQSVPPIRGKRGQPLQGPGTYTPTAVMTTRSTATRSAGSR